LIPFGFGGGRKESIAEKYGCEFMGSKALTIFRCGVRDSYCTSVIAEAMPQLRPSSLM
jgi:hypothetical protein